MSEALKLEVDTTSNTENSTDAFLKDVGWSFVPETRRFKTKNGARIEEARIAELDRFEKEYRIIATAHYALEFSDPRLKSMEQIIQQLNELDTHISNGAAMFNREQVVDDFLLAAAVEHKLMEALDERCQYTDEHIREITAEYTVDNLDSLSIIHRMRESTKPEKSVPIVIGRAAESVIRLAIAKEKGLLESKHLEAVQ